MRFIISSLSTLSTNIFRNLTILKEKLEGNKSLFIFLNKVSNQAALLSLNSAIVASNVTVNKSSFIKITQEIKRFADKTEASTGDMRNIIKGIFSNIDRINKDTTKFLNDLNESSDNLKVVNNHLNIMTSQIGNQAEKFQAINQIMKNQAYITKEIDKSLHFLVKHANENSVQTLQLGNTMNELNTIAEKLQLVLSWFFHPKRHKL